MSVAALIERSRIEREAWKYTSLKALTGVAFKPVGVRDGGATPTLALPRRGREVAQPGLHRFVFVDGVWQEGQSQLADLPPGIMRGDAVSGYEMMLAGQTCLVTSPVELLFMTTARSEPVEMATRLKITLGDSGRLTLIERHEGWGMGLRHTPTQPSPSRGEGLRSAHVVECAIELGAQAKLVHGKILQGDADAAHFARTKVVAAKGAFYDNFTLLGGGALVRNEIEVNLAGEMAQCGLHGLMLLDGAQHADTTTKITHAAPHGTSRQVYKTVLGGKAKGVFQAQIVVAEGAQKTDGHQLSRALLLSDQAEMDAKPELEIYADDVKCSHGSTVGDLDANAMFYLRARGIDEVTARKLLIEAFVNELVDEIQATELRAAAGDAVAGWLRGAQA